MAVSSTRNLTTLFVAMVMLASGCGTLDASIHVTVKDTGEVVTKTTMRGTGALGNALLTPEAKQNVAQEGCEVSTKSTEGTTTLISTCSASGADALRLQSGGLGLGGVKMSPEDVSFTLSGSPFQRIYDLRLKIPASTPTVPSTPGQPQLIDPKQMQQMLDSTVKISVAITLPGKIIASNADEVANDTATWYLLPSTLASGRELQVKSEQMLWSSYGRGDATTGAPDRRHPPRRREASEAISPEALGPLSRQCPPPGPSHRRSCP
jgi:hypothetical protein